MTGLATSPSSPWPWVAPCLTACLICAPWSSVSSAAPARKPAPKASKPLSEEHAERSRAPGSGTLRMAPTKERPMAMRGVGTQDRRGSEARLSTAELAASQSQRQEARQQALVTMKEPGGPAQVARTAAADVGPRSEEAARVLAEKADEAILKGLSRHGDASVRMGLVRALGHCPKKASALVGPLLEDRNVRVLRAAVQLAAQVGAPGSIERLAYLALRHDRGIRSTALRILAMHPEHPLARQTLIGALLSSSPQVRQDAVAAVGHARADWAFHFLKRLAGDPEQPVRLRLVQTMRRLPPSAETLKVLARLATDRDPRVRSEAVRARADLLSARRRAHGSKGVASRKSR